MAIHPTAVISSHANIAADVEIGPLCVIEDNVTLGSGCRLASHVTIKRGTVLGSNNVIDVGAVLGGDPQHMAAGDEVGDITIGSGNQIREFVTIHRAYKPGETTKIGDFNMFMASSHVGHDCVVGDHNILANNVLLAGHVEVDQRNYFGGGAAVHQFCRVGSYTMIGGLSRITRDVPPFVLVDGSTSLLVGLNKVGLRRTGMPAEAREMLKEAYRIAFRDEGAFEWRLQHLRARFPEDPVRQLWTFLSTGKRGFLQDRRQKEGRSANRTDAPKVAESTGLRIYPKAA